MHGAIVGHITDFETIVCRRVNGPTRVQTKRRHRSTVSVADRANPGSDAQRSPGQCNVGCNLHSDSAAFTWTGHPCAAPYHFACLVHLKTARDAPRLLEFAILVWTIPAPVVQIHIAIPATGASGRVERLQHPANSRKRGRTGGTVRQPRLHPMTTPAGLVGAVYSGWRPSFDPFDDDRGSTLTAKRCEDCWTSPGGRA